MPTPGPGIGSIKTEAQLEAFVRDRLRPELTKAMRQGVYLRLATQGNLKVKWGLVADVFAGNAAANADRTWQPVPADLGLTTIAYADLSLEGFASVDLFVRQQVPTTPKITIHNGATAQQFNGYYLAIGT